MATITAIANGDWTNPATWDAGAVPTGADDVIVPAGITVTGIGDVLTLYIEGTVQVPGAAAADVTCHVYSTAANALDIQAGGQLLVGDAVTPFQSPYVFRLVFDQGSSTRTALNKRQNGVLKVYGDPAFYGNVWKSTVAQDWTTGSTVYIAGDVSGWRQGNEIFVGTYDLSTPWSYYAVNDFFASPQDQKLGKVFTIASVGAYDPANDWTPVTFNEPFFSTAKAGNLVWNLSRNILIGDAARESEWGLYAFNSYTERVQILLNAAGPDEAVLVGARLFGLERCTFKHGTFHKSVMTQAVYGFAMYNYYPDLDIKDSVFFSCQYSLCAGGVRNGVMDHVCCRYTTYNKGGPPAQIIGDVVGCYNGPTWTGELVGNVLSCMVGNDSYGLAVTGNIEGCCWVNLSAECKVSVSNGRVTNNLVIEGGAVIYKEGTVCELLATKVSDTPSHILAQEAQLADGTELPYWVVANCGDYTLIRSTDPEWTASGGPPSGNGWMLEAVPNSYCADQWGVRLLMSPEGDMSAYATAGAHTLTFKIYPMGWSSLDNTIVRLRATYLDSATGQTRTEVLSTGQTFTNDAWQDLTVTVHPARDGAVHFNLEVVGYEAGATILVDPVWSLA